MVATGTLPNLPALTAEQAEGWVAAALAEARALRQHDQALYATSDDPTALHAAEQLHAGWRRWAEEADSLYERIRPLLNARWDVAGAHDLDYAIGRTYAMLKLAPRDMLARQEQVQRGEIVSAEEVRREIGDLDGDYSPHLQIQPRGDLQSKLREGLDSGPATEMTAADWDEMRRKLRNRHAAGSDDNANTNEISAAEVEARLAAADRNESSLVDWRPAID